MTEIVDKQISLLADGRLALQPDPSNPLPGPPVAILRKGESALSPAVALLEEEGDPAGTLAPRLSQWIAAHIRKTLEPLLALESLAAAGGPHGAIAARLLDSLGIVARADLRAVIAELEPEGRASLRQKKVRLGPAYVYLTEANKPAAVRLRGLLWALWNGRETIPPFPHEGAVSVPAPQEESDPAWWIALGYPRCGPRIVRVDMHDRLVQSVYDAAHKGVFQAKHEMAEWLGCSIPDLYAVLESLGHRQIEAPLESAALPQEDQAPQTSPPAPQVETQAETQVETQEKLPPKKPDLARFRLARTASEDHRQTGRPPAASRLHTAAEDRGADSRKDKKRKDREPPPHRRNENDRRPRKGASGPEKPERILRAEAKIDPEDSPFAILRGFKISGS